MAEDKRKKKLKSMVAKGADSGADSSFTTGDYWKYKDFDSKDVYDKDSISWTYRGKAQKLHRQKSKPNQWIEKAVQYDRVSQGDVVRHTNNQLYKVVLDARSGKYTGVPLK